VWPGYVLDQLAGSVGAYDVGVLSHIWLENSPLVLLEHLHAGKFVLAPRLGGVVDFIREPGDAMGAAKHALGNGLMFEGGDAAELARSIERLISGEVVVPSPAEVHEASTLRSYPDQVREFDEIYAELMHARAIRPPLAGQHEATGPRSA
jgi:glycosyltransferase involved in cell wall biosynthesis